ncbi:MAG: rhomboid family intramembrane serine protease [Candidatus Methanofastidiosum sp.]|nr:rhomboid family intramembrane serine protease [Methanofastidiosum sp.]
MDRNKQLEYCKKCTKQKFDPKQGIICGLTNQKSDFENECEFFEIDKAIIVAETEKNKTEKKSNVSFGFSPKQIDNFPISDLNKKQLSVIAFETAKKLNWNIGFISESGFIAYTKFSMSSWSEEIQVKIEVGNINVKSECTGNQFIDWGKNRKNIDSFFETFKKTKEEIDKSSLEERYSELSKEFVSADDDIINPPLNKKEKVSGFFSLLYPTDGYFITPIIVILNILLFAVMAIAGVHLILPSNESLLLWGANFRPATIDGELWRLFTSTFIHIGIFHLLMNMYALVYIGLLLEPYLGKSRFLSAYLIAGISGSVASIFWNELTISAGASGAIFGMYGVFIALLTTKLIEKSARKSLLISIGVFVFYNLINGLKGGIDNAAHIGGLISGLIIGYSSYPSLIKPNKILKPITIGILVLVFSIGSFAIVKNTTSDIGKYDADMQIFVRLEEKALGLYRMPRFSSDAELLNELQNNGIKNWEECLKVLEKIESYELPSIICIRNERLREYCELRIKSYRTIQKAITENTDKYDSEISNYNMEIEKIIEELTNPK